MDVEIADISDIEALVEMRLAYLLEDRGCLDDAETEAVKNGLPDYFRAHINRDFFVYVIRDGQRIVSCAFLLIIEKPMSPAFINGRTGTVLNVYTCPSYRRRGYAGMVMRRLIVEGREKELSVIELKSTDEGYSLYRSVGFSDDRSKYHLMKWKNQQINP